MNFSEGAGVSSGKYEPFSDTSPKAKNGNHNYI